MQHWVVAVMLACSAAASADAGWHTGLDFHGTDAAYGARRPIGLSGGLRTGDNEASVVLDPLVFVLGWEMLDVTVGRWVLDERVKVNGGWRQTSGPLAGGRRFDEALLVGV